MASLNELSSRDAVGGFDPNDPLAELSRIISAPRESVQAPPVVSDPQLSIEDSFTLDLERELSDDLIESDADFGGHADHTADFHVQSVTPEPSLEDELSALLGDEAVESEEPTLQFDSDDFSLELNQDELEPEFQEVEAFDAPPLEFSVPSLETAALDEIPAVDTEIEFDADSWLSEPLEAESGVADVDAEMFEPEVQHSDPVLAQILDARPAEHESVLTPPTDHQDDFTFAFDEQTEQDPAFEALEDLDAADFEPAVELDGGFDSAEFADDSFATELPPMPALATAFQPQQELERLLAKTELPPAVEAVATVDDNVELVDEFDVPDIDFGSDQALLSEPSFDVDDDFDLNVGANGQALAGMDAGRSEALSDDFDFDAILEEELGEQGSLSGSLYDDALVGAGAVAAAAAATRARPHAFQATEEPDLDVFRTDLPPETRHAAGPNRRTWFAAATVAALAVVGGAWWAFSGQTGADTSSGPALVKADPQPVKVAPENPGGKVVANQDKAVYDQVSNQTETLPKSGQLVSESEEPLDIAAATPATNGKSDARIDPNASGDAASGQAADTLAIAPKKVKTFVVKSDGTLVERPAEPAAPAAESAAAANVQAPAETPAPEAPKEVAAAENPVPAPEPEAASPVEPEPAQAADQEPAAAPVAKKAQDPAIKVVKTKKIKAPVAEAAPAAAAPAEAPVAERPAEQPVNIVGQTGGQNTEQAAAPAPEQQVAAADPAPQPAASGDGYVIQIASTPSAEAAKSTYAALTRKYGNVISGKGVNIQKANVEGKGTVFRVRIPAGSKQDAAALCSQYKSAGGSCFVSR